jgi:hypothetical protein
MMADPEIPDATNLLKQNAIGLTHDAIASFVVNVRNMDTWVKGFPTASVAMRAQIEIPTAGEDLGLGVAQPSIDSLRVLISRDDLVARPVLNRTEVQVDTANQAAASAGAWYSVTEIISENPGWWDLECRKV